MLARHVNPPGMRRPWMLALVLTVACSAPPCARALRYVNASAGLPPTNMYDCNGGPQICNSPLDTGGWVGVHLGDVNGDGRDDVVAVGRLLFGFRAWLSSGAGPFTPSWTGFDLTECHGRSEVALAHVNGDGALDFGGIGNVNGSPAVFLGDGAGAWTGASAGLSGGGGEGFVFGDWNGDGLTDLASSAHLGGGDMHAFLGDGAGGWREASAGLPSAVWAHRMDAGDFDGDGRDEIVDTVFQGALPAGVVPGVHVWRMNADESWSVFAQFTLDQPTEPAAGDLNGDGLLDLVIAAMQHSSGSFGDVRALLGDGAGGFVDASAGLPFDDTFYTGVDLGDLDNDGDLDIAVGTWSGTIRVFLNDGAASWTEAAGTGLPTGLDNIEDVAIGDADGDCRLDIAFAAYSCGVQVWRQADPPACPILAEAGPSRRICAGGSAVLDAAASRACGCAGAVNYRWLADGALARDWDPSPALVVSPAATTLYRVEVACASAPACVVADVVRVTVVPLPVASVTPATATACEGETVTLALAGAWSTVLWTTTPAGQPGDGATTASIVVAPSGDTTYSVLATDADGCSAASSATVIVLADPLPGPLGPELRVARGAGADALRFTWADLPGAWGDSRVLGLPSALGPPAPATMDGPLARVVATAAFGAGIAEDADALLDPDPLVHYKVIATSPCLGRPGPTAP